jgi:hypothetical protein
MGAVQERQEGGREGGRARAFFPSHTRWTTIQCFLPKFSRII